MILKIKGGHGYPLTEMNGAKQASYDLENGFVRDFLSRVTYSESEVRNDVYTKIAPYWLANEETDYSSYGETGSPVIVVGNGERVVVTPAAGSAQAAKTLEVAATPGATMVYNLVPGVTYTWRLYGSDNKVADSHTFTTTGRLRMIKIAMQNFRDLGGWTCGTGKKVLYGRLYRGMGWLRKPGESSFRSIRASVDTDVVDALKWLGVTLDLDLRNKEKAEPDGAYDPGYPTASGIGYKYCPISSYSGVLKGTGTYFGYMKTALESIADELAGGGGVYFHCKTGYDRTGTLSAIVLALLGVSLSDIVKEYDLSLMNGMKYADKYMGDGKNFAPFLTILLGHSGATLYDKVYGWVTGKGSWTVGSNTYTELGVSASVVKTIRDQLIDGGGG